MKRWPSKQANPASLNSSVGAADKSATTRCWWSGGAFSPARQPFKSLLPSSLLLLIPKCNYRLGEGGYRGLGPPSSGGSKAEVVHEKDLHTSAVTVRQTCLD